MHFEHKSEPLLPLRQFYSRVFRFTLCAICLLAVSLLIGIIGYHFICGLSWIDSFLNSCMILGSMGEINELQTTPSKIFAGLYALYSGIAFLTMFAVLIAPILHRFMHIYHLDPQKKKTVSK